MHDIIKDKANKNVLKCQKDKLAKWLSTNIERHTEKFSTLESKRQQREREENLPN